MKVLISNDRLLSVKTIPHINIHLFEKIVETKVHYVVPISLKLMQNNVSATWNITWFI